MTDRQRRKLKFIVASAIILVCTLFVLKFDNVPNGILMSVADRMSYTDKILFVLTMFRAELSVAYNFLFKETKYEKAGYIVNIKTNEGYRYGYINNKGKHTLDTIYTNLKRVTDMGDSAIYMINYKNGKDAVTHYKVLERFGNATYIECRLETGRTHQIRVHMTSIGHPLLGDEIYGSGKNPYHLQGQTLHAMVLGFVHPRTGEYMEFSAPLAEYFTNLLEKLRK